MDIKNNVIIDTQDINTITESLGYLLEINPAEVEYYILSNFRKMLYEAKVEDFLDFVKKMKGVSQLEIPTNFQVTCYHLTKRINKIFEKEPLLNLQNLLTTKNEISDFFKQYDLTFEVDHDHKIICMNNNKVINWEDYRTSYNNGVIAMLNSRFKGYKSPDSCVNGILFNDDIINVRNIEHLRHAPEIIQDIFRVLPNLPNDIEINFKYLYVVKYKIQFNEMIFDGVDSMNKKDKLFCLIEKLLVYCSNKIIKNNMSFEIPIVRKNDYSIVDTDDIIGYELINEG